ncbi:hypothetical protein QT971_19415 [Microcoleus sp. herbarium19]|uniref:hypothetical protein n=1 Tax=unclassified Microcoleus TaxID=2642155 RepID=UPI002FD481B8
MASAQVLTFILICDPVLQASLTGDRACAKIELSSRACSAINRAAEKVTWFWRTLASCRILQDIHDRTAQNLQLWYSHQIFQASPVW